MLQHSDGISDQMGTGRAGTWPATGLLTLKEIGEQLGVGYGRMRGLADAQGVGEWVGAAEVPGVKGARYPPEAVERFGRLVAAQDAKLVTLTTVPQWVAGIQAQEQGTEMATLAPALPARAPVTQSAEYLTLQAVVSLLQAMVEAMGERPEARAAPTDDRLLTAGEAAALLACRPRAVSRYVKPVLRGKWRLGDVRAFIAALSPQGGMR